MASSSSKRENARGREEMAAITNDAIRFVEMAKDSDVNSKFLLDKATEAIGKVYHSLQTSTKQGKIPRDQITGYVCMHACIFYLFIPNCVYSLLLACFFTREYTGEAPRHKNEN